MSLSSLPDSTLADQAPITGTYRALIIPDGKTADSVEFDEYWVGEIKKIRRRCTGEVFVDLISSLFIYLIQHWNVIAFCSRYLVFFISGCRNQGAVRLHTLSHTSIYLLNRLVLVAIRRSRSLNGFVQITVTAFRRTVSMVCLCDRKDLRLFTHSHFYMYMFRQSKSGDIL